jgi:hypothetical protein
LIDSYRQWRLGLPPQWDPTHANAYHLGVSGESFTEVSCLGMRSLAHELQPANNPYRNPFGTEIALLRTSQGGSSRTVAGIVAHQSALKDGELMTIPQYTI